MSIVEEYGAFKPVLGGGEGWGGTYTVSQITLLHNNEDTVESRYLKFQGTLLNTSRYPYLEISELQKWGKQ